ncbi:MAG: endolytic transglycosylase MltG, partial [Terriglobus sp.]
MKFLGFLLLLILLALGGAAYLVYMPVAPPEETFLDFPVGTGTQAMAQKLEEAHVIRSRYAFLILRVWKGGSLKAGEYRFADPASAFTVYSRIARGDVYTRAVTIPEGFNLYDIAAAVEAAGLGTHAAFMDAAQKNTDLIADLSPNAQSLEGFLYPDTYRFSRHTTPRT